MFTLPEPPLFTRLRAAQRILVAGAAGGFDVYAGLPLAFALADMGKDTDTLRDVALAIGQHRHGVNRRLWRAFPH